MNLFDEDDNPITYKTHHWLGGFFGVPAKQSLFNLVLGRYFPGMEANLLIDIYHANRYSLNRTVIENISDHPIDELSHTMYPSTGKFVSLTSSFRYTQKIAHQAVHQSCYFPYWLFFSKLAQKDDVYAFPETRQYYASCLNRNMRIQRIQLLNELTQKPYFNDMCISFRKTFGPNIKLDFNLAENLEGRYTDGNQWDDFENNDTAESIFWKVKKYFVQEGLDRFKSWYHVLPDVSAQSIDEFYHCARVYEPGWGNSYLNIVTEPQMLDNGFISEKLFKPIRAEQLLLVQGPPHTVAYLRSIGFDMFDNFINHAHYDSEPDWIKRSQLMLEVLDDIYDDIPKIFAATKDARVYNRILLQSQELEDRLLKDILTAIY